MDTCERTGCLLFDPARERHGGVQEGRIARAPSTCTLPARSPHVSCGKCPLMDDAYDCMRLQRENLGKTSAFRLWYPIANPEVVA